MFHMLPSSSVGDLSKSKDLLSVMRGYDTSFPCQECIAKKNFQCYTMGGRQTYEKYKMFFRCRTLDTVSPNLLLKSYLNNVSLGLPFTPAKITFTGVKSWVEVCLIFCIEPMHLFSLAISRMLKMCIWILYEDLNRTCSAIKTVGKIRGKSFRIFCRFVRKNLNFFVQHSAMSY